MVCLHFGALCDPIQKQLNKQGYVLSDKENERFQRIYDAIIMLKLHGVITDSVVLKAEQKLIKMIANDDTLTECDA